MMRSLGGRRLMRIGMQAHRATRLQPFVWPVAVAGGHQRSLVAVSEEQAGGSFADGEDSVEGGAVEVGDEVAGGEGVVDRGPFGDGASEADGALWSGEANTARARVEVWPDCSSMRPWRRVVVSSSLGVRTWHERWTATSDTSVQQTVANDIEQTIAATTGTDFERAADLILGPLLDTVSGRQPITEISYAEGCPGWATTG